MFWSPHLDRECAPTSTHLCGKSRRGNVVVQRRTAADRYRRAIRTIAVWCRRNCHRPMVEQHEALSRKLRGHYTYYGITGNYRALARLRQAVQRVWRRWLSRQ